MLDRQVHSGCMHWCDFVDLVSCLLYSPKLVVVPGLLPLHHCRSSFCLLASNVQALFRKAVLNHVRVALLNKSPSLVEPVIWLILHDSSSRLKSSIGDIERLARVVVDEEADIFQCSWVVSGHKLEDLWRVIGAETFIAKNSLQAECYVSLVACFDPVVPLMVGNLLNLEQLITDLFSLLQTDFLGLFVEYEVRHAVDKLIGILVHSCSM